MKRLAVFTLFIAGMFPLVAAEPPKGTPVAAHLPKPVTDPDLPDGKVAATNAIAGFRYPKGLKVELWAAEPKLHSPIALSFDDRGRVYAVEVHRFNRGTEENRNRCSFFLTDDLQAKTVEDRLAMFQKQAKNFQGGMDWFTRHGDQVRLLEDSTDAGYADQSTVFASGFNEPLDGLAAGVLHYKGDVFLTNIPNLWRLRDTKKKGMADVREKLLTGFGVNCAFLGHDLHGLIMGPDGRLYFSVGDRGFHVKSQEGVTYSGPRTGAVFRCDLDGKNLEVIHRGLRNPQELAFDQYGNLFADDNNCDRGDHGRLVYVVEGGESGWNMAYQSIPDPYTAGPWFAERIWHRRNEGQPAYIVPCVGPIGSGPAGFCFNSGTTLPDRYKNAFFMCNYTGSGGVESWRLKTVGASFEIEDYHDFLKPLYLTDCDFGPDGKMYVTEYGVLKWDGSLLPGRIYTVSDPEKVKSAETLRVKKLYANGFDKLPADELAALLEHGDMKVRLRAQYELAEKSPDRFAAIAKDSKNPLARYHAIWGMAMAARKDPKWGEPIVALLADADPEIRAQAAKWLPAGSATVAADKLIALLKDNNARLKFFAAEALGRIKHKPAVGPLFDLIRANNDVDAYLRHAAVFALSRIGDSDAVNECASDPATAVRLAVVLVQRRLADARVKQFLNDPDVYIQKEAARVVHDLPIDAELPALAAILPKLGKTPLPDADPLVRRAISAAYRLGTAEHAKAVLGVVTNANFTLAARAEALAALGDWSDPPQRDRVTGFWRPLAKRDSDIIRGVVESGLTELLANTSGKLQTDAVALLGKLGVKADETTFVDWVGDTKKDTNLRVAALRFLANRKSPKLKEIVAITSQDASPLLRAATRDVLATIDPAAAFASINKALADANSSIMEKQTAVATLARIKSNDASAGLDKLAEQLAEGKVPAELQIDVLDAISAAQSPKREKLRQKFASTLPNTPTGRFQHSIVGGDINKGREIFFNHSSAQCVRCHKVNDVGGVAGPDLTKLVTRYPEKTREYILESIVLPNARIAPGFGNVTLTLADGRIIAGALVTEDKSSVTLQLPDGKKQAFQVADIENRTKPESPMPSAESILKPREMRDLIEYLMSLK